MLRYYNVWVLEDEGARSSPTKCRVSCIVAVTTSATTVTVPEYATRFSLNGRRYHYDMTLRQLAIRLHVRYVCMSDVWPQRNTLFCTWNKVLINSPVLRISLIFCQYTHLNLNTNAPDSYSDVNIETYGCISGIRDAQVQSPRSGGGQRNYSK